MTLTRMPISTLTLVLAASAPVFADEGRELFEEHCAVCHVPEPGTSHDDLVAPPIFGVAMKYHQAYGENDAVASAISTWIVAPDENKSVMPGWVENFGLMPALELSKDDAAAIANYVATAAFERPSGEGFDHGGGQGHGKGMGQGKGMGHGKGHGQMHKSE